MGHVSVGIALTLIGPETLLSLILLYLGFLEVVPAFFLVPLRLYGGDAGDCFQQKQGAVADAEVAAVVDVAQQAAAVIQVEILPTLPSAFALSRGARTRAGMTAVP